MDDEDNYVIIVPVKKMLEMIENEWNRVYRIWHLFRVDFLVLKVWSKDQAKYAGFFSTFSHTKRSKSDHENPRVQEQKLPIGVQNRDRFGELKSGHENTRVQEQKLLIGESETGLKISQ